MTVPNKQTAAELRVGDNYTEARESRVKVVHRVVRRQGYTPWTSTVIDVDYFEALDASIQVIGGRYEMTSPVTIVGRGANW